MGFFDQGGKAVKFQTEGDTVTGKVISWREAQVTKYGTQEPDFWPDGSAKVQVIIVLETDEMDDSVADDDGVRSLYIAATRQKRALLNALRAGGSKTPDEGGVLTMTYTGNDPKSKNPANPAKLYTASWQAPANKPTETTFNAGLGAPAAEAKVAPAVQPAQQAAPATDDRLPSLIAMGLDDATIAAALGIPAEKVAAARS